MNRELPRNILIAIASTFLTLILFVTVIEALHIRKESVNREEAWHDPNTKFDAELGWAPISNSRTQYVGGTISSNRDGFRSAPIDPNKKHVIIFGDSVAWGYGVSDEQTLAAILESRVGPGLQISNLSVSGYSIDQYYLWLKKNIDKFPSIDRIILAIYSGNDFIDNKTNAAYGKRKPLFRFENGALRLTGVPIKKYGMRNLLTLSYFGSHLSQIEGPRKWLEKMAGDVTISDEENVQVIGALLKEIADLAAAHQAQFSIVLLPSLSDFQTPSADLLGFEEFLATLPYDFLDYHDYLKNKNLGDDLLDAFLDEAHYTPAGNYILAHTLYERYWQSDSPS